MDRRGFFKVTANGILVAVSPAFLHTQLYANNGDILTPYERVQLLDNHHKPLTYSQLPKETAFIFHYPFKATPCFLIRSQNATLQNVSLQTEEGDAYVWKGGVGNDNDLVAYSAICSHQLTHPTSETSFISYVKKGEKSMAAKQDQIIVCASHMSVFDPNAGCKVLGGPAPQPLASIILEVDDHDHIYASAVLGSDRFADFFKAFKAEHKKLYGNRRKAKKKVAQTIVAQTLSQYTKEIIVY